MMKNYVTPTRVEFSPTDFFYIRESITALSKCRPLFETRFKAKKEFLISKFNDVIIDSTMLFPDQLPMICEVEVHSFLAIIRSIKMLNSFCVAENDLICIKLSSVLSDVLQSFNTVFIRVFDEK
jgi:hypothetical protein